MKYYTQKYSYDRPTLVSPIGGGDPKTSIQGLNRSVSDHLESCELSLPELFLFVATGFVFAGKVTADWPMSSMSRTVAVLLFEFSLYTELKRQNSCSSTKR